MVQDPLTPKETGDPIELGDTVALMEPDNRYGRVVGIRKDNCKPIEEIIIRKFKSADGWFPTGEYRTSSGIGLLPYKGRYA